MRWPVSEEFGGVQPPGVSRVRAASGCVVGDRMGGKPTEWRFTTRPCRVGLSLVDSAPYRERGLGEVVKDPSERG